MSVLFSLSWPYAERNGYNGTPSSGEVGRKEKGKKKNLDKPTMLIGLSRLSRACVYGMECHRPYTFVSKSGVRKK